jgi:NRPS condensation-like uncharacterized protein
VFSARLNVFQRLARTWDSVHPYNAAQACRVRGRFDVQHLNRCWNETLQSLALPASAVSVIHDDLERHFSRELNRRLDTPFCASVQTDEQSTWLVITYQHWIADSVSVRALMLDWLCRLTGLPVAAHSRTSKAKHVVTPAILPLLRRYTDYRCTRKVQTMGPLDYPTRVRLVDYDKPIVPELLSYARRNAVTVNDLFVAALARTCNELVPTEMRPGRTHLAISSIVDLRREGERGFGCELGFTSSVCQANELKDWNRLLRAIAHRREKQESAGVLWMHVAEWASRFVPHARIYDFYRKEAPFAGGLSNVNLNRTWFGRKYPAIVLDYIRVSPTGPMVPLVMNVTTLAATLRLSLTYRPALINDWIAVEIGRAFVERLERAITPGGRG